MVSIEWHWNYLFINLSTSGWVAFGSLVNLSFQCFSFIARVHVFALKGKLDLIYLIAWLSQLELFETYILLDQLIKPHLSQGLLGGFDSFFTLRLGILYLILNLISNLFDLIINLIINLMNSGNCLCFYHLINLISNLFTTNAIEYWYWAYFLLDQ